MTLRFLFVLCLLLVVGAAFAWLSDQSGHVVLAFAGTNVQVNLAVALAIVLLLVIGSLVAVDIFRAIVSAPQRWLEKRRHKRLFTGEEWLAKGFMALSTGDLALLKQAVKQTQKMLPDGSLVQLLRAYQLKENGQLEEAEALFIKLLDFDETRASAHQALADLMQAAHRPLQSLPHLKGWANAAPSSGSAMGAVVRYALEHQDFSEARSAVERTAKAGGIAQDLARRQKAALLAAEALSVRTLHSEKAGELAEEAVGYDPALEPAALLAAEAMRDQGRLREASKILEKVWKNKPSEAIAELYIHLRYGDAAKDRLKRAQSLAALADGHLESALMLARAYCDLKDWGRARAYAQSFGQNPRALLLLARIAEEEARPLRDVARLYEEAAHAALGLDVPVDSTQPLVEEADDSAKQETISLKEPSTENLQAEGSSPLSQKNKLSRRKSAVALPAVFALAHAPDDPGTEVVSSAAVEGDLSPQ